MKKKRSVFFIVLIFITSLSAIIFAQGCEQRKARKLSQESQTFTKAAKTSQKETTPIGKKDEDEKELKTVIVYFPDAMAQELLPEKRQISSTDNLAEAALRELFSGPKGKDKLPVIPSGLKVPEITIKNETAELNFSQELFNLYPRGSTGENMFIYAITNTLTDSAGVRKVKFLIDGKPADITGSNYDLKTQVFERNAEIIGK